MNTRFVASAVGLALIGALGIAAPASAERPLIRVFDNRESGPYKFGNCGYRVQAGYYGNVPYVQLKTRNSGCLTYGYDPDDQSPPGSPPGAYVSAQTISPSGYGLDAGPLVSLTRVARNGVTVTQATAPAGRRFMQGSHSAADAGYRVCATSYYGNVCDTGVIDVYPFQ